MSATRLDLLVLRLTVAGDEARLRANSGVEVRVIAGQLVELALAGVLIDYEGTPAIVSNASVAGRALDPMRDRVAELRGWRWDQLFWRQGIYARAALDVAVNELLDSGVWVRTASARPFRPARFDDMQGEQLRELAGRLDDVITGRTPGSVRDRILIALSALRFTKRDHATWMDADWVSELPDLDVRSADTAREIIEAADRTATIMASGGIHDPIDYGYGGV